MSGPRYNNPVIIYHSKAAGGKSNGSFNIFLDKIKSMNLFDSFDLFDSRTPVESKKKIIEIHEKKSNDLLICFGGDGTISSVCNGLMAVDEQSRLPLLPVPGGSGNSFLKDFDINNADDAVNRYLQNNNSMLDVIHVKELEGSFSYYCINLLGMGFISDIADYAVHEGKKYGGFSYILGTLLNLKEFKPYRTKIIYDEGNEVFESDRVFFLTVSNTKYAGGNLLLAPEADFNDGMMDVIILHDINRVQFLNGFRKTFKGDHTGQKGCRYIRTKQLEIYAEPSYKLMPDGELEGKSPVSAKIIPSQIKLVI